MPKKLFAVTNIKLGSEPDQYFVAGAEVDTSKLSKEQLVELHDAGAVEIRVVEVEAVVEPEETPAEEAAVVEETPAEEATEEAAEEAAPADGEAPAE